MSKCRMAALSAIILLVAMFANAASRNDMMRVTVLDSQTQSLTVDDNGVPRNCDQLTFDAYCRSSRTPQASSVLLVQEGNEQPFRISCTIESRFSRCTPLPKGASFEAKRGKKGVTLYYIDDKGRARSQLYKLVDGGSKTSSTATAVAVATPPVPATTDTAEQTSVAPAQHPSVAVQKAPASAPLPPLSQPAPREKVKCNFSSTPPGAEISVDWRYVGNTPSEIGLSAGTHVIVISTPGFAEWKRELTVASDSEVNVTAILQKTQP